MRKLFDIEIMKQKNVPTNNRMNDYRKFVFLALYSKHTGVFSNLGSCLFEFQNVCCKLGQYGKSL